MFKPEPSLGFIGMGKVGTTLARLSAQAGYKVAAVYSRREVSEFAAAFGANAVQTPLEVVQHSDLVFLTVPDDAIERVASAIVDGEWHGKAAVHTSGVHSLDKLEALSLQGAAAGSLHPAFPFAADTVHDLQGTTFAVEASDDRLREWLTGLTGVLGGEALFLSPGTKTLYHAALVIASNYTVTLYAAAERLLLSLGASPATAANTLNRLLAATVQNLAQQGIPEALTGPLVRNDAGTIESHLKVLAQADNDLYEVYRQLARLTYPILEMRGINTKDIEALLQQDERNRATHNP